MDHATAERPPASSPLGAPQREAIDAFCAETRPWALRQARHSYRHLPAALREQAVDRALRELRTRTAQSIDRHTLTTDLAELVTESLRDVHVGWCLSEAGAVLRRDGLVPAPPEHERHDLATFVAEDLGELERAVLQLEIGAGRDSGTTRAALRLGARQYARHRESGLAKLRDALAARVLGRACDQHVSVVVEAATGDRLAMRSLSSGPDRCRRCAREARSLRSVLHERLAVAPWPLAVKPASLLAAKLGAVAAVVGGKSVGGAGFATALGASMGSGASAAATVLAAASLATGTAAVVGGTETPRERAAGHMAEPAVAAAPAPAPTEQRSVAARSAGPRPTTRVPQAFLTLAAAADRKSRRQQHQAEFTPVRARTRHPVAPTDASPTATPPPAFSIIAGESPSGGGGSSTVAAGSPAKPVQDAIHQTTNTVHDTVQQVTSTLPPEVAKPVNDTAKGVQDTVNQLTDPVGGLLKPKR